MATGLLYYDGFDDTTTLSHYLVSAGSSVSMSATAVRHGVRGVLFGGGNSGQYIRNNFSMGITDCIAGGAYYGNNYRAENMILMQFIEAGTTEHMALRRNGSTDQIYITRGGTIVATSATTLPDDEWAYLEMRVQVHDSTGLYEVRINGTQISDLTASGVDTRNGGSGIIDHIRWGTQASSGTGDTYLDDIYVLDRSVGSGFLGDIRVDYLVPDGAGDSTQWTPLSSTNVSNIDETTPDNDTTYNSDSTVGNKDLFTLGDLSGTATVFGVAHVYRHRKDDAGVRQTRGIIKHSSTTTNGATRTESTSYVSDFEHFENCPGSSGWTESQVNALQAGYETVA